MKWNKYRITTKGGFVYECIVGEWLQPGKYSFGEIERLGTLNDEETKEHFEVEQAIYDMWYEAVIEEVIK